MPCCKAIGLAPAETFLTPSRKMAWASTVAVVVPSPAVSFVLTATSRTICAPRFSYLSFKSISFATVTPSLVITGEPNFFPNTTFRPLGPRVTRTAFASVLTPSSIALRASSRNFICLAATLFVSFIDKRFLQQVLHGFVSFSDPAGRLDSASYLYPSGPQQSIAHFITTHILGHYSAVQLTFYCYGINSIMQLRIVSLTHGDQRLNARRRERIFKTCNRPTYAMRERGDYAAAFDLLNGLPNNIQVWQRGGDK